MFHLKDCLSKEKDKNLPCAVGLTYRNVHGLNKSLCWMIFNIVRILRPLGFLDH